MDFGATRTEYILHSADTEHNRKLIEYMNKIDTNNNGAAVEGNVSLKDDYPKIHPEPSVNSNTSNDRSDSRGNDAVADGQQKQSQKHIPNVFDDEVFVFIDSMGKPGKDESNSDSRKAETSGTGVIPANSWRARSNESSQMAKVEQWRQCNTNSARSNHNSTSAPIMQSKPTHQTRVSIAQSTVQSGVNLLSGAGILPCPTYQLNNIYQKFPHLNADKVPNPLKPAPKQTQNVTNNAQKMPASAPAKNCNEQRPNISNSGRGLKNMSELTNSLTSLPVSNKMLASRGRSSSSINLAGAKRSTDSVQHKNQAKDDKGKGAIPKQQNRNRDQMMNVNVSPNSLDGVIDSPVDANKLKSKIFSLS